ncbi:MAG: ABC transporter permease [Anaerolineales bacterium]|jgi:ABC-type dipeptide/oligopeptide/nickel transport system permease component
MVPNSDRYQTRFLITIASRVVEGLITAWIAVTLTFFALRIAVGDPVASLLSQGLATSEQAQAIRTSLGLDQPLLAQYFQFIRGLFRADLGLSLYTSQPVDQIILRQLPSTAALAVSGLLIGILLGFVVGLTAAWKKDEWLGRAASSAAGLLTSLPVAFIGILVLFAVLELGKRGIPGWKFLGFSGLLLPAMVLGAATAGPIGKVIEASVGESMQSAYFQAAIARGYRRNIRLLWHALRPALPPVVSLSALEAAYLFSGTVVTETVFSRPGLGRLLLRSILEGDFPIAQGLVVLAAIFYTFSHLLADILAMLLDPRLRSST